MGLNDEQLIRYSRQILLPQVGEKGQERIMSAKVLVVGVGGLGVPVAAYLAGAGVGRLGLVDSDKVELSNLHRQIIYSTEDIGKNKAEVAKDALHKINPEVKAVSYVQRLSSRNIMNIIEDYDVIVDCSDNFPTRYLVNDACFFANKTLVHGAFLQFEGQAMVVKAGQRPCYRCMFVEPPPPEVIPSCQEAGVLGALAGVIGLVQASETLKLILEIGEPLFGKLLVFNALEMSFRKIMVPENPRCPLCGENATIRSLIDNNI